MIHAKFSDALAYQQTYCDDMSASKSSWLVNHEYSWHKWRVPIYMVLNISEAYKIDNLKVLNW